MAQKEKINEYVSNMNCSEAYGLCKISVSYNLHTGLINVVPFKMITIICKILQTLSYEIAPTYSYSYSMFL